MRTFLFLFLFLPILAQADSLILEYEFSADPGDQVLDTSGNELTGDFVGSSASHNASGFAGKGLKLNGVDDFVLVADDPIFDLNQFTIMSWVRIQKSPWDRQEIMEKAGAFWMNIRQDTQKVRVGGRFGGCPDKPYGLAFDSDGTVPLNAWTHVAATYDGSTLRTYINGVPSGTAKVPVSGAVCANVEPLAIGSKYRTIPPPTNEAFLKGIMDNVRIFDVPLSVEDIRAQMFKN